MRLGSPRAVVGVGILKGAQRTPMHARRPLVLACCSLRKLPPQPQFVVCLGLVVGRPHVKEAARSGHVVVALTQLVAPWSVSWFVITLLGVM